MNSRRDFLLGLGLFPLVPWSPVKEKEFTSACIPSIEDLPPTFASLAFFQSCRLIVFGRNSRGEKIQLWAPKIEATIDNTGQCSVLIKCENIPIKDSYTFEGCYLIHEREIVGGKSKFSRAPILVQEGDTLHINYPIIIS